MFGRSRRTAALRFHEGQGAAAVARERIGDGAGRFGAPSARILWASARVDMSNIAIEGPLTRSVAGVRLPSIGV